MREILFRGQRIDNGEWVEGSLIQAGSFPKIKWQKMGAVGVRVDSLVDPDTVGQYITRHLSEGKLGSSPPLDFKVFEGDVLKVAGVGNVIAVYVEDDCMFMFEDDVGEFRSYHDIIEDIIMVIGTIHDKETK